MAMTHVGSEVANLLHADAIGKARLALWNRLPPLFRRHPKDLLAWVKDAELREAVRSWDWASPCLLVCGPTGDAKSAAVAAIALRLMAKGREHELNLWHSIQWFGSSSLINAAKEWPLGRGECPEIMRASTCKLLILDDLGNEPEWGTTLFDVLQARYESGLKNIITSGLPTERILQKYDDFMMRRLIEREGKFGTIIDLWANASEARR